MRSIETLILHLTKFRGGRTSVEGLWEISDEDLAFVKQLLAVRRGS